MLYLYIVDITIFERKSAFFALLIIFFLLNYHLQASLTHLSVECELSWYKCIKYTLATAGTGKKGMFESYQTAGLKTLFPGCFIHLFIPGIPEGEVKGQHIKLTFFISSIGHGCM